MSVIVADINPDNSSNKMFVIPAEAGIQLIKEFPHGGSEQSFVRFAEYLFSWIPASAGMTALLEFHA